MKVGILTFPHSPSYGASLQMYALYKTVEQYGHKPFVINYQNKHMLNKRHIEQNVLKAKLLNIIGYNTIKRFSRFEGELTYLPEQMICDPANLKAIVKGLDYVIVGSDQVWNPAVTGGDTTYFLDFCERQKKISYAASFGVDGLDTDFACNIATLLADIPSMSVREEKGKKIIKDLIQRDVPIVLDPTFLQTKESWKNIASPKSIVRKPYIFSFIFNTNNENMSFVSRLSKEKKLPIVNVSDNPLKNLDKELICVSGVGPTEFLRLIMDAEYIITDSFHGTVFSIILNRPFYVSLSTKTNSRLETLLSTFKLEDRILNGEVNMESRIDYDQVNQLIVSLREKSQSFLQGSLLGENINE